MRKNFLLLFVMALLPLAGFAAASSGTGANTVFTFRWYDDGGSTPVRKATITGFVDGATRGDVVIPATVSFPKTEGADATTFKVDSIAESAFKKETAITSIDFSSATNLKDIGAGAFEGVAITSLDLEATRLDTLRNLFNSKYAGENSVACPLETLKLPGTWRWIKASAFANCPSLTSLSLIPTNYSTNTKKTIEKYAFEGAKITTLDFSKSRVENIDSVIIGKNVTENNTLTTVTLHAKTTALNASFSNCKALSSINLNNATGLITLADHEFDGCTALTSINLTKVTTLGEYCFARSGLTSVTFHKNISYIPERAFWECANLATVTFANNYTTFNGIDEYGFAYTAIKSIIIPKVLTDATDAINAFAFQGCASLTDFTYVPSTVPTNQVVNDDAFMRCSGVKFHTTQAYALAFTTAPTNTTYVYDVPTGAVKFSSVAGTVKPYKNGTKFYIKWINTTKDIMVKKADAKVYDAYIDDYDKTLNMIQFKVVNGYYQIPANKATLILTNNEDLEYMPNEGTYGTNSSWVDLSYGTSALNINATATTRGDLESLETDQELQLFVWSKVNEEVGFGRYTGSNVPAGTLYCFAKPDETNAAAPKIVWYDENGNVEESPVDNGTTGIESVNVEKQNDGVIYNLAGQKVAPDYKGFVNKNGKQVIIK